jgi:hypothetical protein
MKLFKFIVFWTTVISDNFAGTGYKKCRENESFTKFAIELNCGGFLAVKMGSYCTCNRNAVRIKKRGNCILKLKEIPSETGQ